MADIELVIKIPEEVRQKIKETSMFISGRRSGRSIDYILFNAVYTGTPLPKGHGDLIDAGKIRFENAEFDTYGDYCRAFDAIDQADIIIEADKE